MGMEKILIVTDPMDEHHSVQYELISSLGKKLKEKFSVSVFSTYISDDKREKLESSGINVIRARNIFWMNRFLRLFGRKNESMLWVESWFREAYMGRNSMEAKELEGFQRVINMSTTIPVECDILWIQGRSFFFTVSDIAKTNTRVKIALSFIGRSLKKRDINLLERLIRNSKKVVTNASYLSSFYESMGYKVDKVIHTAKDFSEFRPKCDGKRNYVLTYIGKETDLEPILEIAGKGVRVKGFGSKVPMGISLSRIKEAIEYLGYVNTEELISLYSNALFTAFPFTEEPFGYVPIESMACGTPVLSYNKEGPSETILDGKTGWLVSTRNEFVEKAMKIWREGHTLREEDCVMRASEFSTGKVVASLLELLQE